MERHLSQTRDQLPSASRDLQRLLSVGLLHDQFPHDFQKPQAQIEGLSSTPLERLLANQIVVCWLQVQQAELRAADRLGKNGWVLSNAEENRLDKVDVLPALKDGASTAVFPSPVEGSGKHLGWIGRLGIEPSAPNAYPSPP